MAKDSQSPNPSSYLSSAPQTQMPTETQFIQESDDSQNLWEADCILDERGQPITGQYLVKWKGIDPSTGEVWEPTWEKKTGCTRDLIEEWKEIKKQDPLIVGKAGREIEERIRAGKKRKKVANKGAERKRAKHDKTERGRSSSERADGRSKSPSVVSSTQPPSRFKAGLTKPQQATEIGVRDRLNRTAGAQATNRLKRETEMTRSPSVATMSGVGRAKKKVAEVEIPVSRKRKDTMSAPSEIEDTDEVEEAVIGAGDLADNEDVALDDNDVRDGEQGDTFVPVDVDVPERNDSDQSQPDPEEASPEPAESPSPMITPISSKGKPSRTITIDLSETTTPSKARPARSKDQRPVLYPVPQHSPSTFHKTISKSSNLPPETSQESYPTTASQAERSMDFSQLDPIADFSSPARVANSRRGQEGEREEVAPETQPVKQVKRIIDGEEVVTADVESLDDDEDGGDSVAVMNGGRSRMDGQIDDEDLDDLIGLHDGGIPNEEPEELDEDFGLSKASTADTTQLEGKLQRNTQQFSAGNASFTELGAKLAQAQTAISANAASFREYELQVAQLRKDLAERTVEADYLAKQLDTANKDLTSQTADSNDTRKQLANAKLAAAKLEVQLADVHKTLDLRAASAQTFEAKWVKATKELEDLTVIRNQLEHSREEVETSLMERERLQLQLEQARQELAQLIHNRPKQNVEGSSQQTTPAEFRAQSDHVAELEAMNAKLELTLATLRREKASAQEQCEDIRKMYHTASTQAVEAVRTSKKLQTQNSTLRTQLDLGLKQRNLHFDAIKSQLATETTKYKLQAQLLLEQSRRTDDRVRMRAGLYIKAKRDMERLRNENAVLERRVEELGRRNERLVDHNTEMLARELRVGEGVKEEEEESGSDYEDEDTESGTGSDEEEDGRRVGDSSVLGGGSLGEMGYARRRGSSEDDAEENLLLPDEVASSAKTGGEEEYVEGFRCHVRDERGLCMIMTPSAEALRDHVKHEHYSA